LKFNYDRTVEASVWTVWSVLTDPEAMEPHLPGTAKVVSTGSSSYQVLMQISMGFLRPTANADVQLSNINEFHGFTIELSGKLMGAGVSGKAEVALMSTDGNSRSTVVQLTGSMESSGMLKKVADTKIEVVAIGFLESYFTSVESTGSPD
jgi:carbon monoxide dehydrogenase subunit G